MNTPAALELITTIAAEMLEHIHTDTMLVSLVNDDGSHSYTEEAQEVFNMLHDEIENIVQHFEVKYADEYGT